MTLIAIATAPVLIQLPVTFPLQICSTVLSTRPLFSCKEGVTHATTQRGVSWLSLKKVAVHGSPPSQMFTVPTCMRSTNFSFETYNRP